MNPPSPQPTSVPLSYDVCVLGLGYIGLPTASIFATRGKKVLGVDVVPRVVETINRGEIHIEEPDLDVLVRAAVHTGNLGAATAPRPARVFIVAVPTPFKVTGDQSQGTRSGLCRGGDALHRPGRAARKSGDFGIDQFGRHDGTHEGFVE